MEINYSDKERSLFRKLVAGQETKDSYILDDENMIIVVEINDETKPNEHYAIIHRRLVDNNSVEITRWYLKTYHFGYGRYEAVLSDLNLFKVQNNCGNFSALYDYKKGKFIVPIGYWDTVESGRDNKILKKYNGFLASFEISSDYEEGDVYSYTNSITEQTIVESFRVRDDSYYAIINTDGTIRGNKLFKGSSFSKITQIIDLNQYESLEEFKKERKQLCNDLKQKQKQEYYQMIEARNDGSNSPYLDNEVAKVLGLKK